MQGAHDIRVELDCHVLKMEGFEGDADGAADATEATKHNMTGKAVRVD